MPESDIALSHVDLNNTALIVQRLGATVHERFGLTIENLDTMARDDVQRTIALWRFIINNLPEAAT